MSKGVGANTSEGVEVPHGEEATNPNWGENMFNFAERPLNIPKDRWVLSPHTYGPSVFVQNHLLAPDQPECEELN